MGHPDRLASHADDDTQEQQNLLTDDPFLSLAASNRPSASSVNTNVSLNNCIADFSFSSSLVLAAIRLLKH